MQISANDVENYQLQEQNRTHSQTPAAFSSVAFLGMF